MADWEERRAYLVAVAGCLDRRSVVGIAVVGSIVVEGNRQKLLLVEQHNIAYIVVVAVVAYHPGYQHCWVA